MLKMRLEYAAPVIRYDPTRFPSEKFSNSL